MPHAHGRWSLKHDSCLDCRTTKRGHAAKGYCQGCYPARRQWGDDYLPIVGKPGGGVKGATRPTAPTAQIGTTEPATKEQAMPEGKWHPNYFACKDCGRKTRPHHANGVCVDCYMTANGLKAQRDTERAADDGDDEGQRSLRNLARRDVALLTAKRSAPADVVLPPPPGFADKVMAAIADEPAPSATAELLDEYPAPSGEIPPDLLYETPAEKKPGLFDMFDAPVVRASRQNDNGGNVFADLGLPDPDNLLAAADRAIASTPDPAAQLAAFEVELREHDGTPGPLPPLPDECYPPDATPLDPPDGIVQMDAALRDTLRETAHLRETLLDPPDEEAAKHLEWFGTCGQPSDLAPGNGVLACANILGHTGPCSWQATRRASPMVQFFAPAGATQEVLSPVGSLANYTTEALLAEVASRFARQQAEIAAGEDDRRDADRFRRIAAIAGEV